MLKDNARLSDEPESNAVSNARLPAVEELTLGLKQKLHLKTRTRPSPYYIRTKHPEPVDLVDRLLEERALVAEAVRRLQALQQQCSEEEIRSRRKAAAIDP